MRHPKHASEFMAVEVLGNTLKGFGESSLIRALACCKWAIAWTSGAGNRTLATSVMMLRYRSHDDGDRFLFQRKRGQV